MCLFRVILHCLILRRFLAQPVSLALHSGHSIGELQIPVITDMCMYIYIYGLK